MPPGWGANALLHPWRKAPPAEPSLPHENVTFTGDGGVRLEGWIFRSAAARRRGTVVYLHGVGDNRGSSVGVARHLTPRGFDVVAYDSRAHGQSGGEACTYGFYEKRDLARVLDQLPGGAPFMLLGNSMGAAVALQTAADEPRVAEVIAIATFSDLRTAAIQRAPFFASRANIDEAFHLAEAQGHFKVDEVSPVAAAPRIACPVLLIHGADDHETPPAHSQRVYEALHAPKQLILVPKANHRNVLRPDVWNDIDGWIDHQLGALGARRRLQRAAIEDPHGAGGALLPDLVAGQRLGGHDRHPVAGGGHRREVDGQLGVAQGGAAER
jgi:alpha-beta hydrolase superfamily lysophospholipase